MLYICPNLKTSILKKKTRVNQMIKHGSRMKSEIEVFGSGQIIGIFTYTLTVLL